MTLIDDLRRVFKTSISFILKAVKIPRSTYYYTKHSQDENMMMTRLSKPLMNFAKQMPSILKNTVTVA
ncbi:hypothetical protein [Limosilactobacillus fermentum]|uniref:hypothetical protein n=1 Tax=Limosilactobacillus fermentum TaxID=1613 RepID=UPI003DA46586